MVLSLRRAVLTGAAGTLGRHMEAALVRRGIEVVRLGRTEWDLRLWVDAERLDRLIGHADAVFHFGALTPRPGETLAEADLLDANVRAPAAIGLWAAARGVPLIYASSAGIYAPGDTPADEDAPLASCPMGGFYGLSKLMGEQVLTGLVPRGLHLCSLRITSLYGTGMDGRKLVTAWLDAASRDETIVVAPPVDDAVNLVHAADAAQAALLAAEAEARGTFNIGGPSLVTVEDFAHACIRATGRGRVQITATPAVSAPVRHFDVCTARAATSFGYTPKITLDRGLKLILERDYGC